MVSLIENHPLNEANEVLKNDDKYDYDAIDYEDYGTNETYSVEENNCNNIILIQKAIYILLLLTTCIYDA